MSSVDFDPQAEAVITPVAQPAAAISGEQVARTVARNTLFVTLGNLGLKALNFVFMVSVVRTLGGDRYGQYSIAVAFVGLYQIFAELGVTQYAMREMAQDHARIPKLFWNLVMVRLILGVLGIAGITLGAVASGYEPEIVLGIFLITTGFILSAFEVPLNTVLQARERMDYTSTFTVVSQIVFMVVGGLFLFTGQSYVFLIVASLLGIVARIVLEWRVIARLQLANLPWRIDPGTWVGLVRNGLPFGIISLALTVAFSIDTVILSYLVSKTEVAWYNVSYHLIFSLLFVLVGFKEAIVPSLSKTYVQDPGQVDAWYYRSVKYILVFGVPMAVGGMLVAYPLIQLIYGDSFLPAAGALQILIWDLPLLAFTSICGNMTTIISKEKAAAKIYTINAVANILLNFYAIPRYGIIGAAWVTVITDLIGTLQFHFLLKRELNLPSMGSILARVSAAALVMAGAIWLVQTSLFPAQGGLAQAWTVIPVIALGGLAYLALVLALRLPDQAEIDLTRRLLRRIGLLRGPAPARPD